MAKKITAYIKLKVKAALANPSVPFCDDLGVVLVFLFDF